MDLIRKVYGALEQIGDFRIFILPVIAILGLFTEYTAWIPGPIRIALIIGIGIVIIGGLAVSVVRSRRCVDAQAVDKTEAGRE